MLIASYAPHGAPTSLALGNGLTETMTYNNHLQPGQMRAASSVLTAFDFTYNFYDAQGRNNGNVMRIADQLNAGRSQNFTYDELNRLDLAWTDANSGANCWGLDHGYDIWANLLSASVTRCSAPMLSLGVNANNRITNTGFSYGVCCSTTFGALASATCGARVSLKL